MPMRVKCNANYQNGRLATLQARADGYDTAILLNSRGKVAEGPGMCVFMIRDGKAVTPPVTSDILESITRGTVMTLFEEYLGMEVVERDIDRSEFAAAEEAFLLRHGPGRSRRSSASTAFRSETAKSGLPCAGSRKCSSASRAASSTTIPSGARPCTADARREHARHRPARSDRGDARSVADRLRDISLRPGARRHGSVLRAVRLSPCRFP